MELGSDFTRNPLHYFSQIIIFFTSEVIEITSDLFQITSEVIGYKKRLSQNEVNPKVWMKNFGVYFMRKKQLLS